MREEKSETYGPFNPFSLNKEQENLPIESPELFSPPPTFYYDDINKKGKEGSIDPTLSPISSHVEKNKVRKKPPQPSHKRQGKKLKTPSPLQAIADSEFISAKNVAILSYYLQKHGFINLIIFLENDKPTGLGYIPVNQTAIKKTSSVDINKGGFLKSLDKFYSRSGEKRVQPVVGKYWIIIDDLAILQEYGFKFPALWCSSMPGDIKATNIEQQNKCYFTISNNFISTHNVVILKKLQEIAHNNSNLLGNLHIIKSHHARKVNCLFDNMNKLERKLDTIVKAAEQAILQPSTEDDKLSTVLEDSKVQMITTKSLPHVFILNCLPKLEHNDWLNIVCFSDQSKEMAWIYKIQPALILEDISQFIKFLKTLLVPGKQLKVEEQDIDGQSAIVLRNFCVKPIFESEEFIVSGKYNLIYPSAKCLEYATLPSIKHYLEKNVRDLSVGPESSPEDTALYFDDIQGILNHYIEDAFLAEAQHIREQRMARGLFSSNPLSIPASSSSSYSTTTSTFSFFSASLAPSIESTAPITESSSPTSS
ncbi:MAG: hypothetical protein QM752_07475 [Gammaproteobacteria bacterium]